MQEQDTINILISQILSKDDELVCLRQDNARIREEQREGNRQILEKLDKTLDELKSMRRDNKHLATSFPKLWKIKFRLRSSLNFFPVLWRS
jgi:hypothetical protein